MYVFRYLQSLSTFYGIKIISVEWYLGDFKLPYLPGLRAEELIKVGNPPYISASPLPTTKDWPGKKGR